MALEQHWPMVSIFEVRGAGEWAERGAVQEERGTGTALLFCPQYQAAKPNTEALNSAKAHLRSPIAGPELFLEGKRQNNFSLRRPPVVFAVLLDAAVAILEHMAEMQGDRIRH